MKRTIFALSAMLVVFVGVFTALVLRPVAKVKADHHGCSDATLSGNYALVAAGFVKEYDSSFSMLATFDGKGGLTGSSFNIVYAVAPSGPFTFTTGGSYTVSSDCTCTLTIPAEGHFTVGVTLNGIVVGTGGDEVAGTWYGDETTGTFDAKRVAEGKWGSSD